MALNEGVKSVLIGVLLLIATFGCLFMLFKEIGETFIEPKHLACKDIGFREAIFRNGFDFCIDYNDNWHFVRMDCERLECTAKPISIGGVFEIEN